MAELSTPQLKRADLLMVLEVADIIKKRPSKLCRRVGMRLQGSDPVSSPMSRGYVEPWGN